MIRRIAIIASIPILLLSFRSRLNSAKPITNHAAAKAEQVKDDLLKPGFIKKKVAANHARLVHVKGSFDSFKKYLNSLDTTDITSVPYALDYIKTCLAPNDTVNEDSVFLYFRDEFYSILNSTKDSIFAKYYGIIQKMDSTIGTGSIDIGGRYGFDPTDSIPNLHVRAFITNLYNCGMMLLGNDMDGEDIDVRWDYFYNNFKDRITPDLRDYLRLAKYDDSLGYQEDGSLVFPFDTLYQRVRNWEKFNTRYPNSVVRDEGRSQYNEYLLTLLMGTDNSAVFGNGDTLYPEMKTLYERIRKEDATSKTVRIISSYYDTLSRRNFVMDDSTLVRFMVKNHIPPHDY